MKMKRLAAAAAAAALAVSSLSLSAFAEETEGGYDKKTLTAYLYSKDDSKELDCLFTKANPDLPYLKAEDFLDSIFTVDFETEDKGDGIYEITGNNGALTVDTEKDTVTVKNYERLVTSNYVPSENLGGKYAKEHAKLEVPESVAVLDFSKYGIDLLADDGEAYMPITTLSDIFVPTYNSAIYLDGSIYFNHTSDLFGEGTYLDLESSLQQAERTQEMADYTYSELCFLMDNIYGAPSKSAMASTIKEKGFDKALDEFNEITRAAKEHLKKPGWDEFYYGLMLISPYLDDGGHTLLPSMMLGEINKEEPSDSSLVNSFGALAQADSDESLPMKMWMMAMGQDNAQLNFNMARATSFDGRLKSVKGWGMKAELLADDDTAVFIFDHFESDVVEPFKWSLDYAAEKGLKNFIIDLSTNTGGDSSVVCYMIAMMTNKKNATNQFTENQLSTLTGTTIKVTADLDLNLDGVFDDKDKGVGYDLNFGIISSRVSFSCGNYLPCIAQDNGIPVLGETSGGGGCIACVTFYPDGLYGNLSGNLAIIRNDGTEVDGGVKVDYELPMNGDDPSGFYDLDLIKKDMDDFYGVKAPEESQPESSETESKPESGNKDTNPATGTAASLSLAAAAVGAILIIRKKNR
ncbi:MAG: hypothetical protein IJR91_00660 [Ruminococcus sp.]|nr:hypothetical protein [Ruminococcus sp.]